METSIIICTYNEEKTIASVVSACCTMNKDSEVIVIDDGSTDKTVEILTELLNSHHFIYERLPENKGKSWAMAYGIEIAQNEIILFFDADVSNIHKEHFQKMLVPILDNQADMVLGQPSETLIDYRINPFKSLTGERALRRKDIIPILNDIREIRFGVETFINLYYQSKGNRIKYTLLENLKHPTKYSKTSPINATKEFIKEGHEIASTLVNNYTLLIQRIPILVKQNEKAENKKKLNKKRPVFKKQIYGLFYYNDENN